MNVDKVTLSAMFKPSVQFRIPLFQRHYVWDRTKQWEPLWLDSSQQMKVGSTSHFTGTISYPTISSITWCSDI